MDQNLHQFYLHTTFPRPLGSWHVAQQQGVPWPALTCLGLSGLIDDDESPEAAALRELEEETGYKGDVADCSPGTRCPHKTS